MAFHDDVAALEAQFLLARPLSPSYKHKSCEVTMVSSCGQP
jgi:hypothetical protein